MWRKSRELISVVSCSVRSLWSCRPQLQGLMYHLNWFRFAKSVSFCQVGFVLPSRFRLLSWFRFANYTLRSSLRKRGPRAISASTRVFNTLCILTSQSLGPRFRRDERRGLLGMTSSSRFIALDQKRYTWNELHTQRSKLHIE